VYLKESVVVIAACHDTRQNVVPALLRLQGTIILKSKNASFKKFKKKLNEEFIVNFSKNGKEIEIQRGQAPHIRRQTHAKFKNGAVCGTEPQSSRGYIIDADVGFFNQIWIAIAP